MSDRLIYARAVTAVPFGGAVAVINFYLSFIRYPVFSWFGWQYRYISGIPLIGSMLLMPAVVYFSVTWNSWLLAAALSLIALDTGGLAWAVPILAREYWQSRRMK